MNAFAAIGVLLLASLSSVAAHGYIVEPAATWIKGYPNNGWVSDINDTLWGAIDFAKYGYGPEGMLKHFKENFPESGVETLRDLIMENQVMWTAGVDPVCGDTIKDEAKRVAMPETVVFSGFTHPGPCELWCDDTKLVFEYECQSKYPDGKVPIDVSKCAGADRFTLYWLGIFSGPWQVYTNCVYLTGSTGGSTTSPKPATTTAAPKPATTTAAPKPPTTPTPVADDADDEYATDTPAASTPSPTKKCTAKTRRT